MRKHHFMIFFWCLTCSIVLAQNEAPEHQVLFRKNAVYVEMLGNGGLLSINYDRILMPIDGGYWFGRIGTSEWHSEDTNRQNFSIILETGLLIGKKRHFVDIGFGVTYWTRDKNYFLVPRVSYRYVGKRGLFLRISPLELVINSETNSFGGYWPALGIGYGI